MSVRRPSMTNRVVRGLVVLCTLANSYVDLCSCNDYDLGLSAREMRALRAAASFIKAAQKWDMAKGPNRWQDDDTFFTEWFH